MNTKTLIYLLTYLYTTKCDTKKRVTGVVEQQIIRNLEKQKAEIYSQINSAIEDTIQTLEKANDSDAKEGITHMKDLMEHIKKFSGTDLNMEDSAHNASKGCFLSDESLFQTKPENNTDSHKTESRRTEKAEYGYGKIKNAIAISGRGGRRDLHKLGSGKVDSKKKKVNLVAKIALQKKLDAWKAQRELEKKKVEEYNAWMQIIEKNKNMTDNMPKAMSTY